MVNESKVAKSSYKQCNICKRSRDTAFFETEKSSGKKKSKCKACSIVRSVVKDIKSSETSNSAISDDKASSYIEAGRQRVKDFATSLNISARKIENAQNDVLDAINIFLAGRQARRNDQIKSGRSAALPAKASSGSTDSFHPPKPHVGPIEYGPLTASSSRKPKKKTPGFSKSSHDPTNRSPSRAKSNGPPAQTDSHRKLTHGGLFDQMALPAYQTLHQPSQTAYLGQASTDAALGDDRFAGSVTPNLSAGINFTAVNAPLWKENTTTPRRTIPNQENACWTKHQHAANEEELSPRQEDNEQRTRPISLLASGSEKAQGVGNESTSNLDALVQVVNLINTVPAPSVAAVNESIRPYKTEEDRICKLKGEIIMMRHTCVSIVAVEKLQLQSGLLDGIAYLMERDIHDLDVPIYDLAKLPDLPTAVSLEVKVYVQSLRNVFRLLQLLPPVVDLYTYEAFISTASGRLNEILSEEHNYRARGEGRHAPAMHLLLEACSADGTRRCT